MAVAVAVAGLTKRFFNHIQKDFLINVWGYYYYFRYAGRSRYPEPCCNFREYYYFDAPLLSFEVSWGLQPLEKFSVWDGGTILHFIIKDMVHNKKYGSMDPYLLL